MVNYERKVSAIKKQTRSLSGLTFRVSSSSGTFRVRIGPFDYEFRKSFLSISKWHDPIVEFLPYFINKKRKKNDAVGFEV